MKGEIDFDELDNEALYTLGAACAVYRETLFNVTTRLNDRGETFEKMAEKWKVDRATPARWAKPPAQDRRRRRRRREDAGE